MRIPNRLSALLQTDDKLNGTVLQTISIVKPWFEDNKLVFFPEYTDHGPKHIEEVFETTESLITETAWSLLGSQDAATLIVGIILHDCAMHLSEDGFITLITDGSRPLDDGFRDKPWPRLWDEFMVEAKRFDERKLKALFDDVEPIQPPPLDALTMSKRDRLLIGEFLRRHHPRLAHEIALQGVPGPAGKGLSLGHLPQHIKQLGGLVARSHGLDLRVSVDYLNQRSKWGARRTQGVHVTYLMAVVRIADYLQIHSSRAPQEVLQVRSLRSPVSRGEWNVHAAIKDIHQETDDPEALWVEGMPEDVQTYLRLKYLLTDIQRELDESWAVLGEVYGPKEELRGFGLMLRRIKSNLDDRESFAKTVNYVPVQAALHTAGVDLLKLLIVPLYGDKPEVGIRELLQNAVDACRELKDYLEKKPQLQNVDLQEQIGDVVIKLHEKEDKSKWITISDRGIGMSPDTVLNYFLKAGASFRNSFTWRKQHENEYGESQVLRSGRFGIGVLAGFLLGSEIHVTTRHITARSNEGLSFTCRLEDNHIQLNRLDRPVGTTVSIQIPEATYLRLVPGVTETDDDEDAGTEIDWDWYCLKEPSVHRLTPARELNQRYTLPPVDFPLPPGWRRISHSQYRDIQWTFSDPDPAHDLTCNGLAIADLNEPTRSVFIKDLASYKNVFTSNGLVCPKLSVFDPNGKLPLNLQRTELSLNHLPFEDELIKDVCLDALAYLLVHTPKGRPSYGDPNKHREFFSSYEYSKQRHHPGVDHHFSHYYAEEGLALLDPWNAQRLKTETICSFTDPALLNVLGKSFQSYFDNVGYRYLQEIVRGIDSVGWIKTRNYRLILNETLSSRLDIPSRIYKHLIESKSDGWLLEEKRDKWGLWMWGACPPLGLDLDKIPFWLDSTEPHFLLIVYPLQEEIEPDSRLVEAWRQVIGLPYIPYDISTRKKQLANAYQQLAPYIDHWEKDKSG